ncbi:EAL domain-containing protein [Piscinibacter sp. XHJ-5]|uniref:bifunctional diguanylate cyclase/phosphodiesterase n=1 Tax=Piscinibacter sp. XHJ-5 TaxID=3037797 RepID=UPI002452B074|nr:EAL domain-containing protein [Piscinibacter sp. XHJ-5]
MGLISKLSHGKLVLPLLVFAAGAALSIGLGVAADREVQRGASQRFDAVATDLARKVEGQFDAYTEVLVGLRALFSTSDAVTGEQFSEYVAGLSLSTSYPGFCVVNYAPLSPSAERPYAHPVSFIEPRAGNEHVVGKDLASAPRAMRALEQARDTGGLTSSGRKIKISSSAGDIGLAMRLPVYRPRMSLATVDERRAAYIGSVGAGFSVDRMMRDVVAGHGDGLVRLRLFDAGPGQQALGTRVEARMTDVAPLEEGLLFDSAEHEPAAAANERMVRTLAFDLGGHSWLVEVSEDASRVLGRMDRSIPWLIVLCGIAMSTLLAGIVYSLATARSRAQAIANAMTVHLRTSERQLEEAQHLANLGSWLLDAQSGAVFCSDEARRIFGFDAGPALPDLETLLSRVPDDERAAVQTHIEGASQSGQRSEFEHRLRLADGTERWVHTIVQLTEEDGRRVLRGTVRDDTQRRKGALRLQLEHEIAQLLVSDSEPELVMSRAIEAVCTHLRWDCGAFWGVHEDALARCAAAWYAGDEPVLSQFVRISRTLNYRSDEGSLGRAWRTGEAVVIDTLTAKVDFTRDALAHQSGLATGVVVPIAAGGSATALEFFSRQAKAVDADVLDALRTIALQIAQFEQRKRAEQALRYMASHDSLTGLANRSSLQRDLARAVKRSNRHQKRFAVMFVDIDRFKQINDTLGHGVGDAMIKACGERLSKVLREDDAVARFGGDEFVLVLENLSKASDAAVVADKVLACCAEPFVIGERELHVTASIGVSIYPEDGADGETLLKNADTAMYRAKDKGRGNYQFYAAQMNAQGTERLMIESGLRRAIERGELELHYQPKMNLQTQSIAGVEALMRWRHPVLGMVSPVQFIPIAEETGLIDAMGRWALQQACSDARAWQERGLPPVQMSVNLSPRQLNSRTLIADIAEVLRSTGLDPSLLELEITEGAMMKNPEHAVGMLQQIRDMGIGLAIDDFGTGYSSLSYLKRFPLSTVKIDRSFVNDLSQDGDAQALTDGIITLAHGLRMKVVAEGVETEAQLTHLHRRGCDEIQGYWLCKPLPADAACKFMARHLRSLFVAPAVA